jgi:hypothetical protein
MTIDRRTFITGAALVAIAPSLELLPRQISAGDEDANRIVFLIDGWSIEDGSGAPGRLWIRLDPSWRAAWR